MKSLAYDVERLDFENNKDLIRKKYSEFMLPGFPIKSDLSFVTDVRQLKDAGKPSSRFEVSRYDYQTGLTILTVVDAKKGAVIDRRAEANRPTPLAATEIQIASKIVSERIPDTRISRDTVIVRSLNDDSPKSGSYGHRLLVLWQEKPVRTNRYLIDLTLQKILNHNF